MKREIRYICHIRNNDDTGSHAIELNIFHLRAINLTCLDIRALRRAAMLATISNKNVSTNTLPMVK